MRIHPKNMHTHLVSEKSVLGLASQYQCEIYVEERSQGYRSDCKYAGSLHLGFQFFWDKKDDTKSTKSARHANRQVRRLATAVNNNADPRIFSWRKNSSFGCLPAMKALVPWKW